MALISGGSTTHLELVTPKSIQLLQGLINYGETDISDNTAELFLIGLADLFLTNMGYVNYSSVTPGIKTLMESYEIQILDLEVVN